MCKSMIVDIRTYTEGTSEVLCARRFVYDNPKNLRSQRNLVYRRRLVNREGLENHRGPDPRQNRGECIVRKILFAAILAVGIALVPSTAQASWLSRAWHQVRGDDVAYYNPGYNYYAPTYAPGYGYYDPGYYGNYAAPA